MLPTCGDLKRGNKAQAPQLKALTLKGGIQVNIHNWPVASTNSYFR
jgi:hypothetical protein